MKRFLIATCLLLALAIYCFAAFVPVATDSFNRADAGSLGANWEYPANYYLRIVGNQAASPWTAITVGYANYSASSLSNDQYAQVTCSLPSTANDDDQDAACGLGIRAAGTVSANRYQWTIDNLDRSIIIKLVGGVETILNTDALSVASCGGPQKIAVVGTSITAYCAGASQRTVTDSSLASGVGALVISSGYNLGSNAAVDAFADNFEAGNVTAGAPVSVRKRVDVISNLLPNNWSLIPSVYAQTTSFQRIYVMPVVADTDGKRIPKYKAQLCANHSCGMMDFGAESTALAWGEMDAANDAAITANSDVKALPACSDTGCTALDATLSTAQVNAIKTFLEAQNVPAQWVTTSLTWRQVLKSVAAMFQFFQRYDGIRGAAVARVFANSGVTLDTNWGTINTTYPNVADKLHDAAVSLNYDVSAVTSATTVRQLLKGMADQWGAKPIYLGGVTL